MYSNVRSVQIILSLLKQYGIKDVVLSPGGSDIPLIHSIETDPDFNCFSVVDERSAAYYAMGISQTKNRAVACVCTSGTAVSNYLPGITEAFYQNVPVVAITADKNPYFQDQLETQKIWQNHVFDGVVKKSVDLPLVKTADDEWLCNRLVNEALLELNHNGAGPVQINVPIVGRTDIYDCQILPKERRINRRILNDDAWSYFAKHLSKKRIMVVVGQNLVFNESDICNMNLFFKRTNSIFSTEHLSNLTCDGCLNTYPLTEMFLPNRIQCLKPDLVISIGNNLAAYNLKPFLRNNFNSIENWLIWENGTVRDAYKSLTEIIECDPAFFFETITKYLPADNPTHEYYEAWKRETDKIKIPLFEFSNFYVAQQLSKIIPAKSILHLAILNSTRVMQFFKLNEGVRTYSNVGALGIDGCVSTFAGQAAATEQLAFLLVGDLSFFYDMNAAGVRSVSNNVRIILLNNGGGSEFQFFMGKKRIPTIDSNICAEHEKVAAGWIKSLGYEYYMASNKEEFDAVIDAFGKPSAKPMFLEVLTDMEEDANLTNQFYDNYRVEPESISSALKSSIKKLISEKKQKKIKAIIKILQED